MALAVVPRKEREDPPPPSLRDLLAEAQRAEVRPRNRVTELAAQLDEAICGKRFLDAERLQGELAAAREALAIAEGATSGFRQALDALGKVQAAERKALDDARREDEARRVINDATEAQKRARDSIEEALARTGAALDAARSAYHEAIAWEGKVRAEQQRVIDARVALGEMDYPAPRAPGTNRATHLTEVDPLVRELTRWNGQWRR